MPPPIRQQPLQGSVTNLNVPAAGARAATDVASLGTHVAQALEQIQSSLDVDHQRALALASPEINPSIAVGIHGQQIFDRTIRSAKIGFAQITTALIGDATITTAKIANLSVTTAKIASLAVTTAKIDNLAVTNAQIFAVDASKITTGLLTVDRLNITGIIMQGFTWTDNSPGAGAVAWSTGTLVYKGIAYSINVGNAAAGNKYIFWRLSSMSGGSGPFQSSAAFPTLVDDDFLIATNISGVHDLAFNNSSAQQGVATGQLADAAVTDIKVASISAAKVTTGILTVGGSGTAADISILDGSNVQFGWIGVDSGNRGAWFKSMRIGGANYAAAPLQTDSSGNLTIAGAASITVNNSPVTMSLAAFGLTVEKVHAGFVVGISTAAPNGTVAIGHNRIDIYSETSVGSPTFNTSTLTSLGLATGTGAFSGTLTVGGATVATQGYVTAFGYAVGNQTVNLSSNVTFGSVITSGNLTCRGQLEAVNSGTATPVATPATWTGNFIYMYDSAAGAYIGRMLLFT